jgi:hypothetical protein
MPSSTSLRARVALRGVGAKSREAGDQMVAPVGRAQGHWSTTVTLVMTVHGSLRCAQRS